MRSLKFVLPADRQSSSQPRPHRRRSRKNSAELCRGAIRLGAAPAGEAGPAPPQRQVLLARGVRVVGAPALVQAMANNELEIGNHSFVARHRHPERRHGRLHVISDQTRTAPRRLTTSLVLKDSASEGRGPQGQEGLGVRHRAARSTSR